MPPETWCRMSSSLGSQLSPPQWAGLAALGRGHLDRQAGFFVGREGERFFAVTVHALAARHLVAIVRPRRRHVRAEATGFGRSVLRGRAANDIAVCTLRSHLQGAHHEIV